MCTAALTVALTSSGTFLLKRPWLLRWWISTGADNVQRDQVRRKCLFPLSCCRHLPNFLVTQWKLLQRVAVVWTPSLETLLCSPSLNSPRSNLQTAAEFWQILPLCLLPLGDTFFLSLFSSSVLVSGIYSVEHWPLKRLSVRFSFHVRKTKWIYGGLLSALPNFSRAYKCLFPLVYFLATCIHEVNTLVLFLWLTFLTFPRKVFPRWCYSKSWPLTGVVPYPFNIVPVNKVLMVVSLTDANAESSASCLSESQRKMENGPYGPIWRFSFTVKEY